ncbi:unnamed protein product [Brassica rapa]|uniref:Uncharacterized protein n=1 Tax=Brassica campestris TaxID=3711 RepID=A0A3P6CCB0_BRACM|nr:unnamed protein product [Brassica rapa]VDD16287.1 unnamed protein product [Brassica rapa]
MDKTKRKKEKGGSSSNNNDAATASTSGRSGRGKQSQATNPLTVGQAIMKANYHSCCRQFYTLPELIEFMTTRHRGLTAEMVTKVYREMLKSINAELYLRAAQYHSTAREIERKRRETADSVSTPRASTSTTAPAQSDGDSSSSS